MHDTTNCSKTWLTKCGQERKRISCKLLRNEMSRKKNEQKWQAGSLTRKSKTGYSMIFLGKTSQLFIRLFTWYPFNSSKSRSLVLIFTTIQNLEAPHCIPFSTRIVSSLVKHSSEAQVQKIESHLFLTCSSLAHPSMYIRKFEVGFN